MRGSTEFALTLCMLLLGPQNLSAQLPGGSFGNPDHFIQLDGEEIYRAACQGCHMPAGQGAAGAGTYPALAGNQKLASAGYVASVVVNGLKAMPPFASKLAPSGCLLNDAQVASVVNHVRTHFGNQYTDPILAGDVKSPCEQLSNRK